MFYIILVRNHIIHYSQIDYIQHWQSSSKIHSDKMIYALSKCCTKLSIDTFDAQAFVDGSGTEVQNFFIKINETSQQ